MANNALLDQLRRRNQLGSEIAGLRDQQELYGQALPQGSSPVIGVPGYSTNIGGQTAQMPGQVEINYGDIIGRGVANYLSAKAGKEARSKEDMARELDQDFMMSTLNGDETAQKLFAGAQAGIPGMGQALAQHLAPKKESMGAFLQYLQSEQPDGDVAAQVASRYGVDPELARKAADAQRVYGAAKAGEKDQAKLDLLETKGAQALELEAAKAKNRQDLEAFKGTQRPARETEQSKLTARRADEDIRVIQDVDTHAQKFRDLINLANEAKWNPLNMGLAPDAVNPKGTMLKQAIAGLVLDATGGKLGAGISNADVAFLKEAQVNLDRGNRETAVAQLKNGLATLMEKRDKAMARMGQAPTGGGLEGLPKSQYDYTNSRKRSGGKPLPSIDDILKEFGE